MFEVLLYPVVFFPVSERKWQVSCYPAVPEDSTSLLELCLQHGAAEKRFRVVKLQAAAWKSGASVSTLPDAGEIGFDSSHSTVRHQVRSVKI